MIARRRYAYLFIIILRFYIYSEREKDYYGTRNKSPDGKTNITVM
jgi:hypothetical protein